MHPLDGTRLKLRRAEKHLNTAKAMIDSFIASNPYTFAIEPNPKPPDYVIVAKVNHRPDDELSAIIGDFAHNARSALNLLICQLSKFLPDDRRWLNIQFPIYDTSEGYVDFTKNYLDMAASEHVAIIEGFQPYKRMDGADNDALWILRSINNTDKHRIIHVVGAAARFRGIGFSGPGYFGSNVIVGSGTAIKIDGTGVSIISDGFRYDGVGDGVITKDRTVVAKLTSDAPLQMNMHPEAQISVKFGVGNALVEGRLVMDTLTFINDRVKEVIGEFAHISPK